MDSSTSTATPPESRPSPAVPGQRLTSRDHESCDQLPHDHAFLDPSVRAHGWAATQFGTPPNPASPDRRANARTIGWVAKLRIGALHQDDSLDHLGEASSIYLLAAAGVGRLISDDHGARAVARGRHRVRASSTVGVVAELLARGEVTPETADLYLDTLRPSGVWASRSHPKICCATHLVPGNDAEDLIDARREAVPRRSRWVQRPTLSRCAVVHARQLGGGGSAARHGCLYVDGLWTWLTSYATTRPHCHPSPR